MVLIIKEVDPLWEIAPDLAEITTVIRTRSRLWSMVLELTLIHGKILNDYASKLSLILPTLKVKVLIYKVRTAIKC